MKHIREYEKYRILKKREEIIKESVIQVNDIYRVKTITDIPQSLLNSYVKKVKDLSGTNLRQYFGDVDIAEELVKYVTASGIDSEKIPANALIGGSAQGQAQGQGQMQGQGQAPVQGQAQAQGQAPAQGQAQAQGQMQGQAQAQGQGQMQGQGQAQNSNDEYEEPNYEDDEDDTFKDDLEDSIDDEELPL